MAIAPTTGVPAVDAVLAERAFESDDEAEATAIQLLRVWRALQPGVMGNTTMLRSRRRNRRE